MNRRRFLQAAGATAVVAARASEAQEAPRAPSRPARIGVLYPGADNDVFRTNFGGFREGLEAAGYVEGRNLALDIRFGDGRALAPLAAELVTKRPDVLHGVARPGVIALRAATASIPLVAIDLESDPVASGFVKALARPGGHITGVFMDLPELAGKWLEILKVIVPSVSRVAVLWDPGTGPAQLDAARRAATVLNLSVYPAEAARGADIERAIQGVMRSKPNGMIVLTSPVFNSHRRELAALTTRVGLPTLLPFPGYTSDGGLVSYGPDVRLMYRQAAAVAVKVLAGRPPGEIPIERPTTFTLSCNLTTAKTLGLTIPPSLLARADHIVE